ncbi:MAG: glycosyltransferase, partial [Pyrinomonadaceae bacterium]
VDAFVSGLARLASDAALRREMGERGRVFVQSKYSKKRLVTDIKNLYDDLLLPKTLAAKARDESTMERRASEQAVRTASLKGD